MDARQDLLRLNVSGSGNQREASEGRTERARMRSAPRCGAGTIAIVVLASADDLLLNAALDLRRPDFRPVLTATDYLSL
jgi:hypothetical protein